MRITNQYLWNIVFIIFFFILIVMAIIILETEARIPFAELTLTDFVLVTLASWRLTRLVVYDNIMKWFREQFWDANMSGKRIVLEKPKAGPRRTLADLLSCPWCFGVWATAFVLFWYLVTPYALYPTIFLALSAVASFLQILANLVGHHAEHIKNLNERGF